MCFTAVGDVRKYLTVDGEEEMLKCQYTVQ